MITIRINKNLFKDPIRNTLIDTSDVLSGELPRQIDPEFAEEFTNKVDTVSKISTSVIMLNIIIKLLLRTSLNILWTMVNIL